MTAVRATLGGDCGDQAVVKGLEQMIAPVGRQRCHVKSAAHFGSPAANAAFAGPLAAVVVIGTESGQRGRLLPVELSQFGNGGQHHHGRKSPTPMMSSSRCTRLASGVGSLSRASMLIKFAPHPSTKTFVETIERESNPTDGDSSTWTSGVTSGQESEEKPPEAAVDDLECNSCNDA